MSSINKYLSNLSPGNVESGEHFYIKRYPPYLTDYDVDDWQKVFFSVFHLLVKTFDKSSAFPEKNDVMGLYKITYIYPHVFGLFVMNDFTIGNN